MRVGIIFVSFVVSPFLALGCGGGTTTANEGGGAASGGAGGGAGGSGTVSLPAGCETGLAAGDHTFTIQHGGLDRTFELHLPPGYDPTAPTPLVMNFHGLGSNPNEQKLFTTMNGTADTDGFAVVYPAGIANSWNAGELCCGQAQSQNIDDVGFVRAMVEHLASQACIDLKRVYSTGMSNGGFLSHRLACEASDLVAAVAPVAGTLSVPCDLTRPVPIIQFYGTADTLVDYDALVPSTNARWVELDGCDATPEVTYRQGTVTCETYGGCDQDVTVTLCTAEGMGHCWPGQSYCPFGESTTDIVANDAMWALFQQHALP